MSEMENDTDNACSNDTQAAVYTAFSAEDQQEQSRKRNFSQEEIDVALKAYQAINTKSFDYIGEFRDEQIAHVYYSLLKKGEDQVKRSGIWQAALEIEADREARAIISKMSYNLMSQKPVKHYLNTPGLPLREWHNIFSNTFSDEQAEKEYIKNCCTCCFHGYFNK